MRTRPLARRNEESNRSTNLSSPLGQTGRVKLTPRQLKTRKIHQYLMDETTIKEALQIALIMMHLVEFLDAPRAECQ